MRNYVFAEWLNSNSIRAYPLAENSSRRDGSGSIEIPDSLIVAACINSMPDYASGSFFVSRLGSFPDHVSVDLSFAPAGGDPRLVCSVRVPAGSEPNTSYAITGQGEDSVISGSITIGEIADTQSRIAGYFDFEPSATPFEVSALFVSVPAIKYVEIYSGGSLVGRYGDTLRLRAGRNVSLERVDANTIRIDAVDGLNRLDPDQCEGVVQLGPPIRSINGIAPNAEGEFSIDGGECIEIGSQTNGVTISDTCSKSCCGCEELAALVEAQKQVEAQVIQIKAENSSLSGQIFQLLGAIIGSK